MQAQYLRNWRTGVIFPYSDLLAKQAHLVPCDKEGNPLNVIDASNANDVVREKEKRPFLVNARTGVVLPWTALLAKQEHLHPCDSIEDGKAIYQRLRERKAPVKAEEWMPPAPTEFYKTPHGTASSEGAPERHVARDPQFERGEFVDQTFAPPPPETNSGQSAAPPPPEPEHDVDTMGRDALLALAEKLDERVDKRLSDANIREQLRVRLLQGD